MVLEDGTMLSSLLAVHAGAVEYFRELSSEDTAIERADLHALLNSEVSLVESDELCKLPTKEEMHAVAFSILQQSSLGPDGFGSSFYISCWLTVKDDVLEVARDFFSGTEIPSFYGLSYIVLILKVADPKSFEKFSPISLCSVAYEIFSKIIVSCLMGILPRLISPEKGAFIPGCSIFENISLAQEMVHDLKKKTQGGNVMVKIDMVEAYDRVN